VRTIAIINQKGGCGKTTTAINLSAVLAGMGSRVLLVDLDPQSHCAAGLSVPEGRIDRDISDALKAANPDSIDPERLIWRVSRNLDLIPCRMKLSALESARGGLADASEREHRLTRVLNRFRTEYDACCIDCAPSIGLLAYNALAAATDAIIPVETGFFSLRGAQRQLKTIRSLARRLGSPITPHILATMHDESSPVARDLLARLREEFAPVLVPCVIRYDAALKAAASFGMPVAEHAPRSMGAADYASLATWLVETWRLESTQHMRPTHARHDTPVPRGPGAGPPNGLAQARTDQIVGTASSPPGSTPDSPAPASEQPVPSGRVAELVTKARLFSQSAKWAGQGTAHSANGQTANAGLPSEPTRHETPAAPRDSSGATVPQRSRSCGPSATPRGVRFVVPISVGCSVGVAGDFNAWCERSAMLTPDPARGIHEATFPIPPGRWRYRLVVDGRWMADPANSLVEMNALGELTSVLIVPRRSAAPSAEESMEKNRLEDVQAARSRPKSLVRARPNPPEPVVESRP